MGSNTSLSNKHCCLIESLISINKGLDDSYTQKTVREPVRILTWETLPQSNSCLRSAYPSCNGVASILKKVQSSRTQFLLIELLGFVSRFRCLDFPSHLHTSIARRRANARIQLFPWRLKTVSWRRTAQVLFRSSFADFVGRRQGSPGSVSPHAPDFPHSCFTEQDHPVPTISLCRSLCSFAC